MTALAWFAASLLPVAGIIQAIIRTAPVAATDVQQDAAERAHAVTDEQRANVVVFYALELLEQWTDHLAHETPDRRRWVVAEAVENELAIAVHRHGLTGPTRKAVTA